MNPKAICMANGRKKTAVLSRYKEKNKSWHHLLQQYGYETIIFNKFDGDNLLPNVGREGHTYLYYIVNNYHHLPHEILFTQYDPRDHFKNNTVTNNVKYNVNIQEFLNQFLYNFISIRPIDFDSIVRDRNIDWIQYCKTIFELFDDKQINRLLCCGANLNGVFRVSRRAILNRPLSFYTRCLELLSNEVDPEAGYFFERIWKFIFTSYGCNNNKYIYFNNEYFLFGTDYGLDNHWHPNSNPISSNFSGNIISDRKWKDNAYGHIFLHESGLIMSNYLSTNLYSSPHEAYWSIDDDDRLRFYNLYGGITSIFDLKDISWPLKGNMYQGTKKIINFHWLKKKMFM
jgi:hypothetical protein